MLETLLAISIVFGGWNWFVKESAQDEIEKLEVEIQKYKESNEQLIEVNENNDSVLANLEQAGIECNERYIKLLEEVNSFSETAAAQDNQIKELQDSLADSDFAKCRVPDGISLEGLKTTRD